MSNEETFTFYNAFTEGECPDCGKKIKVLLKVCFEHEIIEQPNYRCFCSYSKEMIEDFYKKRNELENGEFKSN
jgi:hypothetical protein